MSHYWCDEKIISSDFKGLTRGGQNIIIIIIIIIEYKLKTWLKFVTNSR